MFEDVENIADIFRGGFTYCVLFVLSILIICSSSPVLGSSEFPVHRMSEFDVNGVPFGCRSSALSLEAKSLYTWSTTRHCVVAKFQDMTVEQFREIRHKAGGLVLLLPKDVASMSSTEKENLNLLEQAAMEQPVAIPVYFSPYNSKLEDIIADITHTAPSKSHQVVDSPKTNQRESTLNEIFNSISANGYQIVVTGGHVNNKNSRIPIIQGDLASTKSTKFGDGNADSNNKLPLVIVVAHLNIFGMYTDYPLNADAAVLMTMAEMFSKLHNTTSAGLKYRLLFLLTESGPLLNFQGVKKWLDENVQLQNVAFVLCLDSVTQSLNADNSHLYMHVSKPPKENTPLNIFFKHLKNVSTKFSNLTVEGVHKKINLADQQLAWEHERFSIKRLSAFTLSSLKSPNHPMRSTMFRDNEKDIIRQTQVNAKIISEALARYIYANSVLEEIDDFEIFTGGMQISNKLIKSYLNLKSSLQNNDLKNAFEKYLNNVKVMYEKPDAREPDFMLYEGTDATLNVYHVKPAVFDLFLTVIICSYLCSVYFFIQIFPNMYNIISRMSLQSPKQSPIHSNHIERNKTKNN